jgi:hypothetical protein
MRRRNAAALFLAGAFAVAAGCQKRGTPDPSVRMAASHEPDETAAPPAGSPLANGGGAGGNGGQGSDGRVAVPTKLEVPPEVQQAYSGIRIAWKDSQSGKSGTIDVPLGGSAAIPDSGLEVLADVYLPSFTMSTEAITSSGTGEENPAARIQVTEGGKDLFGGWIFNRFPDVHPFQHPRFAIKLEGGIRRAPRGGGGSGGGAPPKK